MSLFFKKNIEFVVEANKLFDTLPKIECGGDMPYGKVTAFKEDLKRLFGTHDFHLSPKVDKEFFRVMGVMLMANNVEGARTLFHSGMSEKSIRPWVVYTSLGVFLSGLVAMFKM